MARLGFSSVGVLVSEHWPGAIRLAVAVVSAIAVPVVLRLRLTETRGGRCRGAQSVCGGSAPAKR